MASFVVIEAVIFAAALPLIVYFILIKRMWQPVFASASTSVALEIVNERFFAGQGTYYPASLLTFPGFAFPVAIVLLSVVYCCLLNSAALKISGLAAKKHTSTVLFAVSLLALNILSLVIEKAGLSSGYWLPGYNAGMSMIYGYIYLFYLAVAVSGSFFFIRRIIKREDSDVNRRYGTPEV